MKNEKLSCIKIRLQFMIDHKDSVTHQKRCIKKLCDVFGFWYELTYVDKKNYIAFFEINFVDNHFFTNDYITIIKTFALQEGYFYLGNEFIDYSDID